jgi:HPr kinase/phosphorylase
MTRLTVSQLLTDKGRDLGLEALTPVSADGTPIILNDLNRPGLALAGFMENFLFERVQILGQTELSYLATLPQTERDRCIERILQYPLPAIVITKGLPAPEHMLRLAEERGVPVLRTALSTTPFMHLLAAYLDDRFAPQTMMHASLVDVYGVGLLFMGRSAIGKSETALDLVERGHRLVADDMVKITRRYGDILIGSGNEVVRHHMEIRGLGVIDVQSIFGIRAIREQKRVEVHVNLVEWDPDEPYERLGLDDRLTEILGVKIPSVTIPIFPGKNITVISEVVALNYLVKVSGYNPAQRLEERLLAAMESDARKRARIREDPE